MSIRFSNGVAVLLAVALAGCQTTGSTGDTIEICDGSGCYTAPRDTATFDPATAVPDADPNGLLPFLVAEAEADPRAAFDLSMRYMRGDGIRRDPWQAIQWMRDAGRRGDARAQSALGRLYLTGLEEMGPDYGEAETWLAMAAARGDREAAELLEQARAARAEEVAFQTALRRWRTVQTEPYWFRQPYYGRWRPCDYGCRRYRWRYDYTY